MPRNKTQTSIVQSLLEERRFSCFHSDRKKMFLLQGATPTVLSDTLALRPMSPCHKGRGSLSCSIYSYQPLSPPPRSRSPPGNDSWRHTQDRSARHTPIKDFQQGQKRKLNLSAGQSYVWPTNSEEVRPEPAWGRKTFDVWFIRLF